MTESPKYPKGRPPKSKNVLLKSTMEPIKEINKQPPVVLPIIPEETKVETKVEPIVEQKEINKEVKVKEKKPRTEQQIAATKRMIEANKGKRKITIVESKPEPTPEPKPEPKPDTTLEDKLRQMEEKLAMMEQQKSKKKPKPEPKPKEPKPKKMQRVESSESEESESESDDDQYVEKYKQKAERRFQAVQAIEQRLQQAKSKPKGKYDHLTLF
jgi:hypothetical protein